MGQGTSASTALVPVGGAWRPTGAQAALLVQLGDLVARRDLPAWELLERGAEGLAALLGDSCIVSLRSDDGRWLHPLGVADPDPAVAADLEAFAGTRLRADRGFARQAFSTKSTIRLPRTSAEVVRAGRPELGFFVQRHPTRSLIVAPMLARGSAVGHVATLRSRGTAPYTLDDERLTQVVANWLGIAIGSGRTAASAGAATLHDGEAGDLSDRECEVLRLLAVGHTNREIAELLVLSVRTVEWHRARIQWKLGVSGRASLVAAARARGLID